MATLKLHQLLALHKEAFSAGEGALTKAFHQVQKPAPLAGVFKSYEPSNEEGQKLPSEGTKLTQRVPVILQGVVPAVVRQMDLQATIDAGNQISRADVVVDGVALLTNVPVETLLFLEKKLDVIKDFLSKVPTLDEAEDWELADDGLSYKTRPSLKARTDKVPTKFEKAPATDKHPAQVDILYLDQVVGMWSTTKYSGAISESRKRALIEKLDKLTKAVKIARGEANSTEVVDQKIGEKIFEFLGWTE